MMLPSGLDESFILPLVRAAMWAGESGENETNDWVRAARGRESSQVGKSTLALFPLPAKRLCPAPLAQRISIFQSPSSKVAATSFLYHVDRRSTKQSRIRSEATPNERSNGPDL